jgi:hypothetical protein
MEGRGGLCGKPKVIEARFYPIWSPDVFYQGSVFL